MPTAVIGSGLAALACTKALLRRGVSVTVLDAGMKIDAERAAAVERMRQTSPVAWSHADLAKITENPTLDNGQLPRKLAFGSDYIYARDNSATPISGKHQASPTLAFGGYGNVWGAAVLPAAPSDIADWPIRADELEPFYDSVFEWLPLSGQNDGLARVFPLHSKAALPLHLSPQSESLLRDLDRASHPDLLYGQARLAVSARDCQYCGLCLSGCVYGAIFNPADAFQALADSGQIKYDRGWAVKTVAENGKKVMVSARQLDSTAREQFQFDRVFIAAGTINSTRIVLESLALYDRAVDFQESHKFVAPLIRMSCGSSEWAQDTTLPAVFAELRVRGLGGNFMHLQISAMNDFILRKLGMQNGRWPKKLIDYISARTMVIACALHSRHSGGLRAQLLRPINGSDATLQLSETGLRRASKSRQIALRALARMAPRFRGLIPPLSGMTLPPGAANHIGGSLPMRSQPGQEFSSDLEGRPMGWQRIHVVDSTILPSVPATTTALPTLANADRIATICKLD